MSEHDHGHDHGHNHDHDHEEKPQSHESGLVSLDQARDIALSHARGNLELYGRRYRRQELAWEVLAQEERESAYQIRLSFRPAQSFQGEPGVEEFTIGRNGSVHSRLIVSQPVGRGGFPGCGMVASLGVSSLLVGGLIASSLVL